MSTKEKRPAPRRTARRSSRSAARTQQPQRRTQRTQVTVRRKTTRRAESQVVYTPPKSFNKFRLLLTLVSVAAIVLALTLGMSIFFKVENITVSGNQKYTAWDIREASGIQEGDNLLTLGKARVGGKIIAGLPYVDQVRIGIKLPDTVNIEITELDVTYCIQAEDNGWWFMNSQGRVLEMTTGIIADYFTKIEGVKIAVPVAGQQAIASTQASAASEPTTENTDGTTEETAAPTAPMDTVNSSEQLTVALTILQLLEQNGIVGEVTSVNVSDLYNLTLLYDDRYQVLLGETTQLDYKIRAMNSAVAQMTDYQRGTLDASFTTWPNEVGYTPAED